MISQEQEFTESLTKLCLNPQERIEIHNKFTIYRNAVDKSNDKINLISHNDLKVIHIRHFWDSICPQFLIPELFVSRETKSETRTLDVGSGAGFPGLPLAITNPGFQHLAIDSNNKRITWLKNLIIEMQINNASVIAERAENLAHDPIHRESYDITFSRALAKPSSAFELVIPFAKVGGHSIFWASGEEWSKIEPLNCTSKVLGGSDIRQISYYLPNDSHERQLVIIKKLSRTAGKYPRRISAIKRGLP